MEGLPSSPWVVVSLIMYIITLQIHQTTSATEFSDSNITPIGEFFPNARFSVERSAVMFKKMNLELDECIDQCKAWSFCGGLDYYFPRKLCIYTASWTECGLMERAARNSDIGWGHVTVRYNGCEEKLNRMTVVDNIINPVDYHNEDAFARQVNCLAFNYLVFRGRVTPVATNFGPTRANVALRQVCEPLTNCRGVSYTPSQCQGNNNNCLWRLHTANTLNLNNNTTPTEYFFLKNCQTFSITSTTTTTAAAAATSTATASSATTTTASGTTTTTLAPSTMKPQNSLGSLSIIGSTGVCPDTLMAFTNSQQDGGYLVPGVSSQTGCQAFCIANSTCAAVDFNFPNMQCFFHPLVVASSFMTNMDCCTHFRKINCTSNMCYAQRNTSVSIVTFATDALVLASSSTSHVFLQDCKHNLCLTRYVNSTLTRSCAGSATIPTRRCITVPEGTLTDVTCVCEGDRCNSMGIQANLGLIGYYPFDAHTRDLSGFFRHATNFAVSFSQPLAKKNFTGIFDGSSSFAVIRSYMNIQIGQIVNAGQSALASQSGTRATTGFAFAMWIQRTGGTGTQVVLSNGPPGQQPILVESIMAGTNNHAITVTVTLRTSAASLGTLTASTLIPNSWYFIAGTLRVVNTTFIRLDLFSSDTDVSGGPVGFTELQVNTIASPIFVTISPMCIGKQYLTSNLGTTGGHFNGYIDELRLWDRGDIDGPDFQTIIDQTSTAFSSFSGA